MHNVSSNVWGVYITAGHLLEGSVKKVGELKRLDVEHERCSLNLDD